MNRGFIKISLRGACTPQDILKLKLPDDQGNMCGSDYIIVRPDRLHRDSILWHYVSLIEALTW